MSYNRLLSADRETLEVQRIRVRPIFCHNFWFALFGSEDYADTFLLPCKNPVVQFYLAGLTSEVRRGR